MRSRAKSWDAIIIGAGIIGVSLALELRHQGMTVLMVERGEPGREASHAGAGMLAALDPEIPRALAELARMSADMYPEFVAELQSDSGMKIDFRREGTIYLASGDAECAGKRLTRNELRTLEPALECAGAEVFLLDEASVDPRDVMSAALEVVKQRGIEMAKGSTVTELVVASNRVLGAKTARTEFIAPIVINCCGAWAGEVAGVSIPTRPVKGQLLSVVFPQGISPHSSFANVGHSPTRRTPLLQRVVRSEAVYLVPRSDGRILIGATVEEAGFDKRVDPDTINRLHREAAKLVPGLGEARIHEAWAGLRPGSPDDLPIMGATSIEGYFVSSGHYRNGILLAPASAKVMSRVMRGVDPGMEMAAISSSRFGNHFQIEKLREGECSA